MPNFSERMGLFRRTIQKESMDLPLKNAIWSVTYLTFWKYWDTEGSDLLLSLWTVHFHNPADDCPDTPKFAVERVKKLYFSQTWAQTYDFVEFVAGDIAAESTQYAASINGALVQHSAAYRLVAGQVTPITGEEEIAAVEESLAQTGSFAAAGEHIRTALLRLSDRDARDYRNSIKESISAVESACQVIAGEPKATLGDALKRIGVHKALEKGFGAIYGYTNDADGIRHVVR